MGETQELSTIIEDNPITLSISVWLDASYRQSMSKDTRRVYEAIITTFRNGCIQAGIDLDGSPEQVALLAQVYASHGPSGELVSSNTYNQRLAALSSYYKFARRRRFIRGENPIEMLSRAKVTQYASAVPLDLEVVTERLALIDQESMQGARDYALLSVLLYTGRRASEVCNLRWRDVSLYKGKATLTFERVKGGDVMRDELPTSVTQPLLRWMYKFYGSNLGMLDSDTPLWVSLAPGGRNGKNKGNKMGVQAIADVCKRCLGSSKIHATRHTFAHRMDELGAPVSEIQARLGHKSIATTGRYLQRLRQARNSKGEELAALYGIE